MGVKFEVNTKKLEESAAVIEEKTSKFNSEWAKLYQDAEALVATNWQTETSKEFKNKLEGYRNDFEDMSKILLQYADFLKTTSKNYDKNEDGLKSAASGLKIGK